MNKLNFILLKIVRWSSWPLLPVLAGFLVTGYAMTGQHGFSRLLDEKTALTIHRMLHWPLIVLVLAHSVPAVYLAVLVGAQFPLANRLQFDGTATGAARLYTADFVGASLGALLASTLLIPLVGVIGVCLLTAALNVLAGGVLFWRKVST